MMTFFYFKSDLYAFKKNEFLRKKSNIESANRFAIAFTVSKICPVVSEKKLEM
jgi:hypothetical protein